MAPLDFPLSLLKETADSTFLLKVLRNQCQTKLSCRREMTRPRRRLMDRARKVVCVKPPPTRLAGRGSRVSVLRRLLPLGLLLNSTKVKTCSHPVEPELIYEIVHSKYLDIGLRPLELIISIYLYIYISEMHICLDRRPPSQTESFISFDLSNYLFISIYLYIFISIYLYIYISIYLYI